MRSAYRNWSYIIIGNLLIVFGITLFFFHQTSITLIKEIITWSFLFLVTLQLFRWTIFYKESRSRKTVLLQLSGIICGYLASYFLFHSDTLAIGLFGNIMGFYQFLLAFVNLISYYLLVKDNIDDRFKRLIYSVFHLVFAYFSFNLKYEFTMALNVLGVYVIFIGLTHINDGRGVVISKEKSADLKRKFRIPIPPVFHAVLPTNTIRKINEFIASELSLDEELVEYYYPAVDQEKDQNIIQVHIVTSPKNIDIIGHVEIAYNNRVYNYGNYDVDSRVFFDSIGDGVLCVSDKEKYLEYALNRGSTIIEFEILITDKQKMILENKLDQLAAITYPWQPTSPTQLNSYGGEIFTVVGSEMFKFTQSRYKTYFAMGTNCVLLADDLIGISGLDLFLMVGVMTPGTYYEYLDKEYKKTHSKVIQKKVYNKDLINYIERSIEV